MMNKPRKPDLFILVDDLDAIKVWAEQIECALSSLVPEVTTARKGARHLYLTKQYPTCKKLLFMLDTKSDIYRSDIVDTWLKHFSSLKPKDIICVLVYGCKNAHCRMTIQNMISTYKRYSISTY